MAKNRRWTSGEVESLGLKAKGLKTEDNAEILPTGKQTILGNVPSKSNCYKIITIMGHSSLGKTPALKKYENDFYIQCNQYRNKSIQGYFELHLDVFYPSQRSDLDNSLKVVLDCLQKVKAIENDNKTVKIVAQKFLDKANPRIEFELVEIK